MAQDRCRRHSGKNLRTLKTYEVGQFVYKNKPLLAVLASKTNNVGTASYDILMHRMADQYKMVTVRDNTLTVLRNGIENTISTDRATRASGFYKIPCGSTNKDKIPESQPPIQDDEFSKIYNN